jgi:hypothetical protein
MSNGGIALVTKASKKFNFHGSSMESTSVFFFMEIFTKRLKKLELVNHIKRKIN